MNIHKVNIHGTNIGMYILASPEYEDASVCVCLCVSVCVCLCVCVEEGGKEREALSSARVLPLSPHLGSFGK